MTPDRLKRDTLYTHGSMFARTIPYTFYSAASIPKVGFHPRFRIVTLVFRRCWLRGIEVGEASNWLGYIVATTSFDHLESFPQWLPRSAVKPRYKSCRVSCPPETSPHWYSAFKFLSLIERRCTFERIYCATRRVLRKLVFCKAKRRISGKGWNWSWLFLALPNL